MELDENTYVDPPRIIPPFKGVIDDDFLTSCNNIVTFFYPKFDWTVDDYMSLMSNGRRIFAKKVTQADMAPGQTFDVPNADNWFNYTGRCNLHFLIQKANTFNTSLSDTQVYVVQRNGNSAPDDPQNAELPAPVLSPAIYNKNNFDGNENVDVTITYPRMSESDSIVLKFELRRTTCNYSGVTPTFYDVEDITIRPPALGTSVTYPLPPSTFQGVDENIARVYYVVTSASFNTEGAILGEESTRNKTFVVDVVPPYTKLSL